MNRTNKYNARNKAGRGEDPITHLFDIIRGENLFSSFGLFGLPFLMNKIKRKPYRINLNKIIREHIKTEYKGVKVREIRHIGNSEELPNEIRRRVDRKYFLVYNSKQKEPILVIANNRGTKVLRSIAIKGFYMF